jgi:hypothetical protein
MHKHYVVMLDWANQYAEGVSIIGIAHSREEAKKIFVEQLVGERLLVEDSGYDIEVDEEDSFEAGMMGSWMTEHRELYIQEVE